MQPTEVELRASNAFMTSVIRDVRHAVRRWPAQPAFFVTTVATIALAIGANTLIFALVRHILLAPLPVPDPDRLVRIEEMHATGPASVTGATVVDVSARSRTLQAAGALRILPPAVIT